MEGYLPTQYALASSPRYTLEFGGNSPKRGIKFRDATSINYFELTNINLSLTHLILQS